MNDKEKPTIRPIYFWCLACNASLGSGTLNRLGLCPHCLSTLNDYDYPFVEIKYSHTNIRDGATPIPSDPYDPAG